MKKQRAYSCGSCDFFDGGFCRKFMRQTIRLTDDAPIQMITAKTSGCKYHSSLTPKRQKHSQLSLF